jgi:hypothetical protein
VSCTVLGGLYFTVVVPRPYAAVLGRENEPAWRPPASAFVGQIASILLVVLTSAVLLRTLDMRELGPGLLFGLVVGIGYLAAMVLNIAFNPSPPLPLQPAQTRTSSSAACSPARSSPCWPDREDDVQALRRHLPTRSQAAGSRARLLNVATTNQPELRQS